MSPLLEENIRRRIIEISVQVKHAKQRGISNVAKTGYYRSAITFACTIAEALLFELVKEDIATNNSSMGKSIIFKSPHILPKVFLNTNVALCDSRAVLCIKEEKEILLSEQTKFNELIDYARRRNLVSKREKSRLDNIRKLRNRIHLQSLTDSDNGYTSQKLENIFKSIDFLIKEFP